jgi:hypothetical protein
MNPVFHVRRDGAGDLLAVGPKDSGGDGIDETWIHVQLVPSVDRNAFHEAERLLPGVLADLRRVAADSTAMIAVLDELAHDVETNANGHYPGADTAATSPPCCAGWPMGISRCWATSAARCTTDGCRGMRRRPASVCCAIARVRVRA